ENLLQPPHELKRSLRVLVVGVRVQVAETGQRGQALVYPRVVLHRAGAERVEARVDAERAVRESRDVPYDLRLRELGEPRRTRAAERLGQLRHRELGARRTSGSPPRARALEDQRRRAPRGAGLGRDAHPHTSSSTLARRSTSATLFFSVTAASRTSSMPS